jgi:hypothetical protein
MFHVEHMSQAQRIVVFGLLLVAQISCTRVDPEAYKSDPILQDYVAQKQATVANLEALNKQIQETQKELESSVPQSGQLANYRRKLYELQNKAQKLQQQTLFWTLRIEARAKEAQLEYLQALGAKKPWPDKQKVESYMAEKRLRIAKIQWNQKDRIKELNSTKRESDKNETTHDGSPAAH